VAEDNAQSSSVLQDYLQAHGYRVVVARDGQEALDQMRDIVPAVILMDIQIPGMDGLEAIRHIRADEAKRQIPIVAMTALAMPGDRERCLVAGATAYLAKPVNLRTLATTIAEVLAGSDACPT
jgi:CheY-like chemotaxis protein